MRNSSTLLILSLFTLTACDSGSTSSQALSENVSPASLTATCDNTSAPFGGGTGTSDDPYLICSSAHLLAIDTGFDSAHFLVTQDIDASSVQVSGSLVAGLNGVIDGGNHTISNFTTINSNIHAASGFVGVNHGTIKNLALTNVSITGTNTVGAIAGTNTGTISNVAVSGSIQAYDMSTAYHFGGVAGWNNGGTISNVGTQLTINADNGVGGVVGFFQGGIVNGVEINGTVNGTTDVSGQFGITDLSTTDGGTGSQSVSNVTINASIQ